MHRLLLLKMSEKHPLKFNDQKNLKPVHRIQFFDEIEDLIAKNSDENYKNKDFVEYHSDNTVKATLVIM